MKPFEVFTAEDCAWILTTLKWEIPLEDVEVFQETVAARFNAILNERGKRVSGCPETDNWERDANGSPYPQTHEALLIGEREIE